MIKEKQDIENLNKNLKLLDEIANWFDGQEEINIEQGLKRVKEAVELIKASKKRLGEITNEFEEIKKEVENEENKN